LIRLHVDGGEGTANVEILIKDIRSMSEAPTLARNPFQHDICLLSHGKQNGEHHGRNFCQLVLDVLFGLRMHVTVRPMKFCIPKHRCRLLALVGESLYSILHENGEAEVGQSMDLITQHLLFFNRWCCIVKAFVLVQ
jgi:hypothetical protein